MSKTSGLFASLVLLLASCGAASDPKSLTDAAMEELNRNDTAAALAAFESALTAIGDDSSHTQFGRAKMGYFEALASEDASRCQSEFLAYALEHSASPSDYSQIGNRLVGEDKFAESLAVVDQGLNAHQGHAGLLQVVEAIKKEAESDEGLASALAGLGYL